MAETTNKMTATTATATTTTSTASTTSTGTQTATRYHVACNRCVVVVVAGEATMNPQQVGLLMIGVGGGILAIVIYLLLMP